jgi:anti-sigma B factor antagonist
MMEATGSPVIVKLPAEIDITNAPATLARLFRALDNPGLVIADMTGTTFCDSAGLRMLITARDRAGHRGSTLRIIIRPDGSVSRALAILGMDRMLPIYATMKDATTASPGASQPAK